MVIHRLFDAADIAMALGFFDLAERCEVPACGVGSLTMSEVTALYYIVAEQTQQKKERTENYAPQ